MKLSNVLAAALAATVVYQGAAPAQKGCSNLLRPPGAQGEQDFLARCIKCGKCIEACPYQALKPVFALGGVCVGTPQINARDHACRLCEDFPCVEACPTDALRMVDRREQVNMGRAVIDEDVCIAFQGIRCEVCYRTCPLIDQAISIDYRVLKGDESHAVFAPIISNEHCVGCGLCVERCVIDEPRLAINIVPDTERIHASVERVA